MPSIPVLKFEAAAKQESPVEKLPFKREHVARKEHDDMNGDTNTGRWSSGEHKIFVQQLQRVGKDWRKISEHIKTRSAVQVRTHAQKYFLKLRNAYIRKNKFLSEEENDVLNKFVLDCENSDDDREGRAQTATIKGANLKRKRSAELDYSSIYPVRRRGFPESNSKVQDKLSVAIKPVAHPFCDEPDALDLLQLQALAARDSVFELDFFEPDGSEASDMLKPFIREPVWSWNHYGLGPYKKLEPCGRSELGDALPDEECLDLLYVL